MMRVIQRRRAAGHESSDAQRSGCTHRGVLKNLPAALFLTVLAAAIALAGITFAVKAIQDYRRELEALEKKLKEIEEGRRALGQQLLAHRTCHKMLGKRYSRRAVARQRKRLSPEQTIEGVSKHTAEYGLATDRGGIEEELNDI